MGVDDRMGQGLGPGMSNQGVMLALKWTSGQSHICIKSLFLKQGTDPGPARRVSMTVMDASPRPVGRWQQL